MDQVSTQGLQVFVSLQRFLREDPGKAICDTNEVMLDTFILTPDHIIAVGKI